MAIFAYTAPCIPSILKDKGSLEGKAPNPITVVAIGMPVFFTNAASSFEASLAMMPPPAYISGRFAVWIACAAFLHWKTEGLKLGL